MTSAQNRQQAMGQGQAQVRSNQAPQSRSSEASGKGSPNGGVSAGVTTVSRPGAGSPGGVASRGGPSSPQVPVPVAPVAPVKPIDPNAPVTDNSVYGIAGQIAGRAGDQAEGAAMASGVNRAQAEALGRGTQQQTHANAFQKEVGQQNSEAMQMESLARAREDANATRQQGLLGSLLGLGAGLLGGLL